MRFDEPMRLDRMTVYYTRDPQPAVKLLELPFGGGPESAERRAQSAERL
jgi:hypothetical protein